MGYPPYRFQRSRVCVQARNDVPMNVGKLIAEQFVVDLPGRVGVCHGLADQVDLFY
jgi:hypothetical protein